MELTDKSNLKKIVISLRKKGVIDEKIFIQTIDEIKLSSRGPPNGFVPLIDMISLIDQDSKIQTIDSSLDKINLQMENVVKEWEERKLAKDETRKVLTELVSRQNQLILEHKHLQDQIFLKVSRLKKLNKLRDFNLEKFTSSLIETSDNREMSNITAKFREIWPKYSEKSREEDFQSEHQLKLDDIEADIVNSLMTPITEENPVIFNLEEVVKPIIHDKKFQPLLKDHGPIPKKTSKVREDLPINSIPKNKSSSIWNLVGKIAYNSSKNPLGLFRPPIVVSGKNYLPIVWEESLPLSVLKKQYRSIFDQTELDLNQNTTQEIRTSIAKALKVPNEMALQPSLFNKWISLMGVESKPAKPQLSKVRFAEEIDLPDSSSEYPIIRDENLVQLRVSAWIPAPGGGITTSIKLNQRIYGMAKSKFGNLASIMENTPFGQALIIQRDIPPSYILDLFLDGLGKENLANLRFSIAKKLNIGEGEAFSPESLWLINNQERLLISPHEILTSYYTILPSAAFTVSKEITAKIGVYYHSIPETFKYLIGSQIEINGVKKGLIYGFSIDQGRFFILWSSKTSVDVIKEIGRKSSSQYVNKFQKRVSMALGIPLNESMWPSNLARYFMNFIWIEENQSLQDALVKIEQQFTLQKVLFSDIKEISENGLRC